MSPRTAPRLKRGRISTLLGASITALLALLGLATSGIWGMVLMLALVVLVTAMYGLLFRRRTWLLLPKKRRSSALALGAAFVVLIGASSAYGATHVAPAAPVAAFAAASPEASRATVSAQKKTPVPTATRTPTPTPTPTPVMTRETVTETSVVVRGSASVDDGEMDQGTTTVTTGADGILSRTIEITKRDGVEVSRTTLSEVVTTAPIDDVVHNGTRVPPPPAPEPEPEVAPGGCDPNYAGVCVPIASDVDCEGGSGNGPAYVDGPLTIVGSDIYDLDRDGDGIACDA